MATLSVTVPDDTVPRVVSALRTYYPDLADPALTDAQVGRRAIVMHLRMVVAYVEGNKAAADASASVQDAQQNAVDSANTATSTIS